MRVKLPGGRVFYAKYERVKRVNLPPNPTVKQTYRRQIGSCLRIEADNRDAG